MKRFGKKTLMRLVSTALLVMLCAGICTASSAAASEIKHDPDNFNLISNIDIAVLEAEITGIAEEESVSTGARIATNFRHSDSSINFGITTEGIDIDAARYENQKIINSMVKNLAKLGINTDNIMYYNYSCYPTYGKNNEEIIGYRVSTNITISLNEYNNNARPELLYK